MSKIIQLEDLVYKHDPTALEAFDLLTLSPRLSKEVGSKHLIFDYRTLNSGKYSFPYHFHWNAEELLLVLSGYMTLRSSTGLEIVNNVHLIFFEMGETSVHQFFNHGSVPCVYLDIRTSVGADVVEYSDSGKINIGNKEMYEKNTKVDYNKGEENVQMIWEKLYGKEYCFAG